MVLAGFDTTLTFRLTDQDTGKYKGADGLTLVVENDGVSAIGAYGAAGGFARTDDIYSSEGGFVRGIQGELRRGVSPKLAIFLDTYQNPWEPYDNYVLIGTQSKKDDMRCPCAMSFLLPAGPREPEGRRGSHRNASLTSRRAVPSTSIIWRSR